MKRVDIQQIQPDAYKAMFALEGYLATTRLDGKLQELVRLRASQINGCAFCTAMHTDAAAKQGETTQRLDALPQWHSSSLFDEKEKTVLAATESMTLIAGEGLPDDLYRRLTGCLNETEIAQLIMLVATINAWNRIGIATAA